MVFSVQVVSYTEMFGTWKYRGTDKETAYMKCVFFILKGISRTTTWSNY